MTTRKHRKTHDVDQSEKMIPFITSEMAFPPHVCDMVLGIYVFDLDFGVQATSGTTFHSQTDPAPLPWWKNLCDDWPFRSRRSWLETTNDVQHVKINTHVTSRIQSLHNQEHQQHCEQYDEYLSDSCQFNVMNCHKILTTRNLSHEANVFASFAHSNVSGKKFESFVVLTQSVSLLWIPIHHPTPQQKFLYWLNIDQKYAEQILHSHQSDTDS